MNSSKWIGPKCTNKDCNQEFTIENLQLAIYLYGIFFLIRADKGFYGITCPKCLETSLYPTTYQELRDIKKQLSWVEVVKKGINENGNTTIKPVCSFEPDLKYYSPFVLPDEVSANFDIKFYVASSPSNDDHIFDSIHAYVDEEMPEVQNQFCSYILEDDRPAGISSAFYWFREDDIQALLKWEKEKELRIFPRYHFYTELVGKIDPLLRANHFMGKEFEKAKADHEKERMDVLEMLKAFARKKNLNFENFVEENALNDPDTLIKIIEKKQDQITKDPKLTGDFMDMLISDPHPFDNIMSKGICDYLWTTINPFHNKKFPEIFISQIEPEDDKGKAGKMKTHHAKMVERVQENITKQYVQEFLKNNLTDFLEEYEELMQSNQFSYANIWQLKESYLEGLYKDINIGLRDEKPYAMYREGESWKIVFNGKHFGGLKGKGFRWLYLILLRQPLPVYYISLHDNYVAEVKDNEDEPLTFESNSEEDAFHEHQRNYTDFEQEAYEDKTKKNIHYAEKFNITHSGTLSTQKALDEKAIQVYNNTYGKLLEAIQMARSKGDTMKAEKKEEELSSFRTFLKKEYGIYFSEKNNKLKSYSLKIKDERYKKINDNIKKNYRDAMKIIKTSDKELHAYLSEHIRKEGGAFIYTPSEGENIDWHLD